MKISIFLLVLAYNYQLIVGHPGIVESNIDLKKFRENREKASDTISTKLTSHKNNNLIGNSRNHEKFIPMPSAFQPFQPMHLTRDDVVTSAPPIQQNQPNDEYTAPPGPAPSLANGGVIFAIQQGQDSQSSPHFTSAAELTGQPVLVQYMTPEGEQRVSYVQFLRPIVMVPAQPYQPAQPVTLSTRHPTATTATAPMSTTATPSQSFSYFSVSHDQSGEEAPYAAPLTASASNLFPQHQHSPAAFHQQQQPSYEMNQNRRFPFRLQPSSSFELNTNEFLPSASTQSFSAVLPPSQPVLSPFPQPFHHQRIQAHLPPYRRFAQRA